MINVHLFILVSLLTATICCSGEADPVQKWVEEVGSEDFDTREAAQKALIAFLSEVPSDKRMQVGHRVAVFQQSADNEAKIRIANVLQRIERFENRFVDDESLLSNHVESLSSIHGFPVVIYLVTSAPMLRFYRNVVQTKTHGLNMPDLDFKDWMLVYFGVTSVTSICTQPRSLQSPSCTRNFKKMETICNINVGTEKDWEQWSWPKTSLIGVQYRLHMNDLPLVMKFKSNDEHLKVDASELRYQLVDANWKEAETIIKKGNLYGFRKLAETCDETIPAETRRDFLQKTYMIDPLLPYVMFSHLAKNHPDVFKQDYEYWKDKGPDVDKSWVVGKLFRAALEEGKKIVEEKGKGAKPGP